MIYVPKTSQSTYISSILALNVISPEYTGDWHSCSYWDHPERSKIDLWIFGDGQKFNTNCLLGSLGVIDGTKRLNEMGYFPENKPVWIAEHSRAVVDLLYVTVLKSGNIGAIILDDWFPTIDDKKRVYSLLSIIEKKLDKKEYEILQKWKEKNPITE